MHRTGIAAPSRRPDESQRPFPRRPELRRAVSWRHDVWRCFPRCQKRAEKTRGQLTSDANLASSELVERQRSRRRAGSLHRSRDAIRCQPWRQAEWWRTLSSRMTMTLEWQWRSRRISRALEGCRNGPSVSSCRAQAERSSRSSALYRPAISCTLYTQ